VVKAYEVIESVAGYNATHVNEESSTRVVEGEHPRHALVLRPDSTIRVIQSDVSVATKLFGER
jgi:hypothetical protein